MRAAGNHPETSAKEGTGVEKVFQEVAKKVPRQAQTKRADVVPLRGPENNTTNETKKTSSKCC